MENTSMQNIETDFYPNRKNAKEIVNYLREKYPLIEVSDAARDQMVIDNVLMNEPHNEKLPKERTHTLSFFKSRITPQEKSFMINKDKIFKGLPIIVGIELETGFFHVEGSSELWDELFAFRGLDEADLENYYLVAEYIHCLRKFNLLAKVVSS